MSLSGREPEVSPRAEATACGTLEIAHVLFTDIVGYSLLPMDKQKDYLAEFQQLARHSARFQAAEAAGEIITLPTGDGMALVFLRDPLAPLQCALEVAEGLKNRPHLKVRMGVNSGPVFRVSDVNANANVAGGGINMAQRVMDCGDAGHILVSKGVADTLMQLSQWAPHLIDLGEAPVKHGVKVHIYSFVQGNAGTRELPIKLKAPGVARRSRHLARRTAMAAALALAIGAGWWLARDRLGTGQAPDDASIAVLPFADLSAEKNQAYFAEGMAEELLEGLAQVPGLRVAARTSSFTFRGLNADLQTIRDKLAVANILQGSVRKQGNRARISVQLIKTADGFQLWSDTFDRDMSDILAVEQDIARTVIAKLKLTALAAKRAAAPAANVNAAAYDAYLQAIYLDRRGSRDSLQKAADLYEQSLRLDSGSARAWASLGSNLTDRAQHNYISRDEGYRKARQALDRARALDPNLASPNSTLAWISMYHDWNWEAASFYSKKALNLDPGSTVPINTAATLAMVLGHREEAIALYGRAIRIDPLSSAKLMNQGGVLYYAGRYAEAEASIGKAIALAPDRDDVHLFLGLIRLARGETADAVIEMDREKNPAHRLFGLSLAHRAARDNTTADADFANLMSGYAGDSPYLIAEVCAYRGDNDRAFEWLERAYEARDSDLTEVKGNPLLRGLEHDPRYRPLLKKIGLPV